MACGAEHGDAESRRMEKTPCLPFSMTSVFSDSNNTVQERGL